MFLDNEPKDYVAEPVSGPAMQLAPQIVRIGLRYLAGFLVAKGILDAGTAADIAADQAVIDIGVAAVGLIIAAGTEWWFRLSVKKTA